MPLSPVSVNKIYFTGAESRNDNVVEAAAVTGGVGAGCAAARGGKAFSAFKSSAKLRSAVTGAAEATEAMVKPINQSKSLWNAFKINAKNLRTSIANWAKNSKMPKFMKGLFTGKLGKAIGGLAAVFVFITGVGEVVRTFAYDLDKINKKAA